MILTWGILIYVIIPIILIYAVFPGEYIDFNFTKRFRYAGSFPIDYIITDYNAHNKHRSLFYTSLVVKDKDDIWAPGQFRDLTGRDLNGAVLDGSNLDRTKLKGAKLRNASLIRVSLREADLTTADLSFAELDSSQMQGATLADAEMVGAPLVDVQAQGADMHGASLRLANLRRAQLQGASLVVAKLQGSLLLDARVQGARLDYANLIGADFHGADIRGASLEGSHLQGAMLTITKMDGTSFADANVWRTQLLSLVPQKRSAKLTGLFRDGADPRMSINDLSGEVGELTLPRRHWRKPKEGQTVRAALEASTQVLRPDYHGSSGGGGVEAEELLYAKSWEEIRAASPDDFFSALFGVLKDVACRRNDDLYFGSPNAAMGLIKFGLLDHLGPYEPEFKKILTTPKECVGAAGLDEKVKSIISIP
jgi:uncharacterized protein YjbI with pentapeptide repeats